MKEISLSCVGIPQDKTTVIEVKTSGSHQICRYRIEPFMINDLNLNENNREHRVEKLRNLIQNYDKQWELIQIYNSNESSEFIHILYREKNTETTLITHK
jgi:hypothetical protein